MQSNDSNHRLTYTFVSASIYSALFVISSLQFTTSPAGSIHLHKPKLGCRLSVTHSIYERRSDILFARISNMSSAQQQTTRTSPTDLPYIIFYLTSMALCSNVGRRAFRARAASIGVDKCIASRVRSLLMT